MSVIGTHADAIDGGAVLLERAINQDNPEGDLGCSAVLLRGASDAGQNDAVVFNDLPGQRPNEFHQHHLPDGGVCLGIVSRRR
jgi:hypothetical protein